MEADDYVERLRRMTKEIRVMLTLLILVPLAFVAAALGWPSWLQFILAVGSVIPLASFIGSSTEALADRLGGKIGGLLNATFGNAPDILVGVFGVQKGLIPLVKATLVGALISNSALIMGLCYLVAGLTYGRLTFRKDEAGHHSVLMMLVLAAILFPSVGALSGDHVASDTTQHISSAISVVLLLSYLAYVAYGIFGWERLRGSKAKAAKSPAPTHTPAEGAWPVWLSVGVLVGATVGLIPITDILTGSVEPVGQALGWTDVFVGMVIVANAGNVAEAYAALKLARQRAGTRSEEGGESGLDLALGIASASSVQIATFVAPIIVLYSLFTSHSMNLVFSPVELSILALLVILFTHIAHDGESNWLEGAQLLALYAMAAILFFALPISSFGS
jgi:Ca2+:H+ antiporter